MCVTVQKKLFLLSLLAISLVLTGCMGQSTGFFNPFAPQDNNPMNRYFVGTEGVNMRFSDPSAPPPVMWYDSSADPDDNQFIISVDVQNVGSSWSRGGLFVSGYDPSMIRIKDIDIPRLNGGWGDCVIDFGVIGGYPGAGFFDSFMGNIGCSETGFNAYSQGSDNWGFAIRSLGDVFGQQDTWWSDIGFNYDNQNGNPAFGMSLTDNFNLDFLNRGNGLLIMLSGLDFQRFNGKEYILAPDDYNYPGGEMDTIIFEGEVRGWPRGLDATDRPVPFQVTNCFAYATYAAPQVCVDPAPFDQGVNKVCQPREITFNGGNGAPVAVTSVEQENSRNYVYFTINIQNMDNGRVFDMGYLERCSPYFPGRVSQSVLDKVYILDARIGEQHLYCTPDRGDGVRLVNGRGQFRCRYTLEYQTARSAYETPLIIELGYGYSQNIQRQMIIKRII